MNGAKRELREVGGTGQLAVEYMERFVPYQVELFPFQVSYSSMKTPMWVGVDILDEASNPVGRAEVHLTNGKKGLVVDVVHMTAPMVELTFDADELEAQEHHEYFFWPYVKEGQRDSPSLPPTVVSVTFAEKKRGYRFWNALRKKLGMKGVSIRRLRLL